MQKTAQNIHHPESYHHQKSRIINILPFSDYFHLSFFPLKIKCNLHLKTFPISFSALSKDSDFSETVMLPFCNTFKNINHL